MDKKNAGTHNELVITRIFDAPLIQVWNAWKEPEIYKKWWGGKDFTCPFSEIDFREGGKYLYSMRGPDGNDIWGTGIYKEIVPMEKIVVTDSFADEKGNVVSAERYGMENFPLELLITVAFEEIGKDQTKMTLRHIGLPEGEMKEMIGQGWNESFDKMAQILK